MNGKLNGVQMKELDREEFPLYAEKYSVEFKRTGS